MEIKIKLNSGKNDIKAGFEKYLDGWRDNYILFEDVKSMDDITSDDIQRVIAIASETENYDKWIHDYKIFKCLCGIWDSKINNEGKIRLFAKAKDDDVHLIIKPVLKLVSQIKWDIIDDDERDYSKSKIVECINKLTEIIKYNFYLGPSVVFGDSNHNLAYCYHSRSITLEKMRAEINQRYNSDEITKICNIDEENSNSLQKTIKYGVLLYDIFDKKCEYMTNINANVSDSLTKMVMIWLYFAGEYDKTIKYAERFYKNTNTTAKSIIILHLILAKCVQKAETYEQAKKVSDLLRTLYIDTFNEFGIDGVAFVDAVNHYRPKINEKIEEILKIEKGFSVSGIKVKRPDVKALKEKLNQPDGYITREEYGALCEYLKYLISDVISSESEFNRLKYLNVDYEEYEDDRWDFGDEISFFTIIERDVMFRDVYDDLDKRLAKLKAVEILKEFKVLLDGLKESFADELQSDDTSEIYLARLIEKSMPLFKKFDELGESNNEISNSAKCSIAKDLNSFVEKYFKDELKSKTAEDIIYQNLNEDLRQSIINSIYTSELIYETLSKDMETADYSAAILPITAQIEDLLYKILVEPFKKVNNPEQSHESQDSKLSLLKKDLNEKVKNAQRTYDKSQCKLHYYKYKTNVLNDNSRNALNEKIRAKSEFEQAETELKFIQNKAGVIKNFMRKPVMNDYISFLADCNLRCNDLRYDLSYGKHILMIKNGAEFGWDEEFFKCGNEDAIFDFKILERFNDFELPIKINKIDNDNPIEAETVTVSFLNSQDCPDDKVRRIHNKLMLTVALDHIRDAYRNKVAHGETISEEKMTAFRATMLMGEEQNQNRQTAKALLWILIAAIKKNAR